MKKTFMQTLIARSAMLISMAGLFAAPMLQAQQVTLNSDTSNYSFGNGGEFNAAPDATLLAENPTLSGYVPGVTAGVTSVNGGINFQTFCVETMEFFNPGGTYNVSVGQTIMYNNGQFPPPGGLLTLGTAWLYSQFAAGTLGGYDYTVNSLGGNRIDTAGQLQSALWYLQGEDASLTVGDNGADGTFFYNEALSALGSSINDPSLGTYGVWVLNLTSDVNNQDQLMVIPNLQAVPEPGYLSFGVLALLSLGAYKRWLLSRKQTA